MAKKLTPKRVKFCQLYLELGDASAAYRGAFCASRMKPETVNRCAHELLKHPKIAARIRKLAKAAAKPHEITAERLMGELAKVGFADLRDFVRLEPDGRVMLDFTAAAAKDSLAALSEITQEQFTDGSGEDARDVRRTRFKLHDKLRAIELMGKRLGIWIERHQHDHGWRAIFEQLPPELRQKVIEALEARGDGPGLR